MGRGSATAWHSTALGRPTSSPLLLVRAGGVPKHIRVAFHCATSAAHSICSPRDELLRLIRIRRDDTVPCLTWHALETFWITSGVPFPSLANFVSSVNINKVHPLIMLIITSTILMVGNPRKVCSVQANVNVTPETKRNMSSRYCGARVRRPHPHHRVEALCFPCFQPGMLVCPHSTANTVSLSVCGCRRTYAPLAFLSMGGLRPERSDVLWFVRCMKPIS